MRSGVILGLDGRLEVVLAVLDAIVDYVAVRKEGNVLTCGLKFVSLEALVFCVSLIVNLIFAVHNDVSAVRRRYKSKV